MPRKKVLTEAELLAERERIDAEIRAVRDKENINLGKAVKRIFGSRFPNDHKGRLQFLENLNQMLVEREGNTDVSSERMSKENVSEEDADEDVSVEQELLEDESVASVSMDADFVAGEE